MKAEDVDETSTSSEVPESDVATRLNEDFLEKMLSDAKPEVREILLDPAILYRYK